MDEATDSDLTRESLIHDLNNVFETITEVADLLSADRHWKPLAATLTRSVARGKRLIGAIPDSTPSLAIVIEDAIQNAADYAAAARKPHMTFVRNLPECDIRLPGADKDWERVFANLFLNAVQVMRKPGRIEISAEQIEGALKITIADNGPGIPEDILPGVFRAHVSTKASTRRSGLGLHIVATIVKRYSGRVTAENRESSRGAIFTIHLPVAWAGNVNG
ncbi:MAG: ATP-binding protein [Bryobacteraceae bacterium]